METSSNNIQELQEEYILIDYDVMQHETHYTSWTPNATKRLISLYKQYHSQIGMTIKKQKQLWEIIAHILNKEFNLKLLQSHVENKWRALLRSYKAVIDNNNRTGRSRKVFVYQEDMDEIFQKKENIHPKILLSEDTIVEIPNSLKRSADVSCPDENSDNGEETDLVQPSTNIDRNSTSKRAKVNMNLRKKRILTRNEVLEKYRSDKQKQHEEFMKKLNERIALERDRLVEKKDKIRYKKKGIKSFRSI